MKEFDDYMEMKQTKSKHTLRSYHRSITNMLSYLNINTIEDFKNLGLMDFKKYFLYVETKPATRKYKKYQKDGNTVRNNSYNTELRNNKIFSAWLKEMGLIEIDYLAKLEYKQEEELYPIALEEEERQAMMKVARSLDDKISIGLMLYMGLREFELLDILVTDVKEDGSLTVLGKGNKKVKREIPPFLFEMIREYISTRDFKSDYLLVSKVGKHKITNTGSIYGRVKRIAKKAGVPQEKLDLLGAHTCRRTFACLAAENNVPPIVIQKMMRHSTFSTTEKYLKAMSDKVVNRALSEQPVPDWR